MLFQVVALITREYWVVAMDSLWLLGCTGWVLGYCETVVLVFCSGCFLGLFSLVARVYCQVIAKRLY